MIYPLKIGNSAFSLYCECTVLGPSSYMYSVNFAPCTFNTVIARRIFCNFTSSFVPVFKF